MAADRKRLERREEVPVTASCRSCSNTGIDFLTNRPCSCPIGRQVLWSERHDSAPSQPNLTVSSHLDSRRHGPHEDGIDIGKGILWLLIVVSVILNLAFVAWPMHVAVQAPLDSSFPAPVYEQPQNIDTDGDGVPDHHDFCPGSQHKRRCKGPNCPPMGWQSGKATDFDSDGCADGTEDKDKDNDGILDQHDKCPYTPQKWAFVSNAGSDFDRDGCADGLEDTDDDNDKIPNFIDKCPSTGNGDMSDNAGCSKVQREAPVTTTAAPGSSLESPSEPDASEAAEEPKSKAEEYTEWVGGASFEVVLGAILSAVLAKVLMAFQKGESSPSSLGAIKHGSSSDSLHSFPGVPPASSNWNISAEQVRGHLVRMSFYLSIVIWMRYNGCLMSPGMCVQNASGKVATLLAQVSNQSAAFATRR